MLPSVHTSSPIVLAAASVRQSTATNTEVLECGKEKMMMENATRKEEGKKKKRVVSNKIII